MLPHLANGEGQGGCGCEGDGSKIEVRVLPLKAKVDHFILDRPVAQGCLV